MKMIETVTRAPVRLLILVILSWVVTGCAVGNKYSYQDSDIAIRVQGTGQLGVAVVDNRPYVLNGDKSPAFIGLQRGGFGNPFDVSTSSGKPLAQEVRGALATALRKRGFLVTELSASSSDDLAKMMAVESTGVSRNIFLSIREWKTDAMARLGLSYDLLLQVVEIDGDVLASTSSQGSKESLGPGGFEEQNALLAKRALATKIEALFNDPAIRAVLTADSRSTQ